jgi:hypothetical protein
MPARPTTSAAAQHPCQDFLQTAMLMCPEPQQCWALPVNGSKALKASLQTAVVDLMQAHVAHACQHIIMRAVQRKLCNDPADSWEDCHCESCARMIQELILKPQAPLL